MTTKYALEVSVNNGGSWQFVALFDDYNTAMNAQYQIRSNYPNNAMFQVRYVYV